MGTTESRSYTQELQELSDQTGFSLEQLRILHRRFKHLTHDEGKLRKEDLESISDLEFNPIKNQIIDAFFDKRNFRQGEVGMVQEISFREFVTVMSHFRPAKQKLTEEEIEAIRRDKLRFLFNMHDTDNDGTLTLDEYRHTRNIFGDALTQSYSHQHNLVLVRAAQNLLLSPVVEELLSSYPDIETETAKSIADAAMNEVASVTMGEMAADQVYEGITFEHFLQILQGVEIETRMHIRFLYVDTTMSCTK